MKSLPTQLYFFMRQGSSRIKVLNLLRFLLLVTMLVAVYSVLFHVIMEWEGQTEHSWITGLYWTLTVMSTLGFGDITFQSDLGRIFSSVVLMSGILFLLILFPFTFIEFFYTPWVKAQEANRAPNHLPENTRDHIILTKLDAVTDELIEKLTQYRYSYVLLVPNLEEALSLHDQGYRVVLGDLDNPLSYERCRVAQAALVATTANDMVNTNVVSTVREIAEAVPILATANSPASVDILELAGSTHVFRLGEMLGQALARRVGGGGTLAHVIGNFDQLLIAESTVSSTSMVGQTLRESALREGTGVSVLGVWQRGKFEVAGADTLITPRTVLVLAGKAAQIQQYNALYAHECQINAPILIIGGGRVGRAVGEALTERGLDYRIVEKMPERVRNSEKYVLGDAADIEVLEQAGINETSAVVVTTHDDDINIYLTIYCRKLRPEIQVISRSTLERNLATLHRAGADFVLSYASMGAHTILNLLNRSDILLVTEGLELFKVAVPSSLVGKELRDTRIREEIGCSVVALQTGTGVVVNPDPTTPLPANAKMILIGSEEQERQFLEKYGSK
jgi:voltage-gated potassium channel